MRLKDKVAIVTGSARGAGEAIAKLFAAEGASVVLADVLIDQARQVAEEINKKGGKSLAVKVDISNKEEVQNLAKATLDAFKGIHILVNDAAIMRRAPLLEITEEDWDTVLAVDLKGAFFCTQAVLGHMIKQRYGKIVNISSIGGLRVTDQSQAHYAAAKAGVIQLTKVTAMEAGKHGINVNSIAPAMIMTPMNYIGRSEEEMARMIEGAKKHSLIGRLGRPEDIANLALFLASDESSYITGQDILCDGGRSIYT